MAESVNSESILTCFLKIKELQKQLSSKENNDWIRLMQAPQFLQEELHKLFKTENQEDTKKALKELIKETEELLKIGSYHKFLNGNSVKIWSPLKSIHTSLIEFEKSLNT